MSDEISGWWYFLTTLYIASVIVIGFYLSYEMHQSPSSLDSPLERVSWFVFISTCWPLLLTILLIYLGFELLFSPIRRLGRYLGGHWDWQWRNNV